MASQHGATQRAKHEAKDLSLYPRLQCCPLLPYDRIYPSQMQLLYAIAKSHDLNFKEQIFLQIMVLALARGNKKPTYFSSLIFVLCKKARVPISSSKLEKAKPSLINYNTIRQSYPQIT